MKAVYQTRYGAPEFLELREISEPSPGEGEALIRVRASSVNAADWHLMKRLPHLIGRIMGMPTSRVRGSDLAGEVAAVGRGVTDLGAGDEVFGAGIGAFAEYAVARADRLAPKPHNLTFEQAAALPVAGCTALQGLRDHACVKAGQRVLIYGAGGGVGTFAVQIAKWLGAHVTAVTRTSRLELVRSLGADEVIDHTQEDFSRRGSSYDVLFDIGSDRSYADCRRVLGSHGTHVLCGAPRSTGLALWRLLMALAPQARSRRLPFLARVRREILMVLKELAESGRISPAIDRVFPLTEVPDALRRVGAGQANGKVVVRIG